MRDREPDIHPSNEEIPAERLHLDLLGTFRLLLGGQPVAGFEYARLQHLLAYLALHRSAPISRQQLAFRFWPDSTDQQALKNLRTLLTRLRHALPSIDQTITITAQTIQWRTDEPLTLDVAEFERAVAQASVAQGTGDYAGEAKALAAAVAAYTGELLPGCYDDWILTLRDLKSPGPLTEAWQRTRLFEAQARAILGPDPHTPLLLFLDDLQWCDQETLDWLGYLLRFNGRAPLLIVAAVRKYEIDRVHPLMAFWFALTRSGLLSEVSLEPLNAGETGLLAANIAGRAVDEEEAALIYRITEGNPLFVVENVRAVPVLFPPAAFPPKVRAVIQWRLAQLSPSAQSLVQTAAALGRKFSSEILAQANDQDVKEELERVGFKVTLADGAKRIAGKVEEFNDNFDAVLEFSDIRGNAAENNYRIKWLAPMGADIPWFVTEKPSVFVSLNFTTHLTDMPMVKYYINAYKNTRTVIRSVIQKIICESDFKGQHFNEHVWCE